MNFKNGQWIILKDEYIENWEVQGTKYSYIERFSKPNKIVIIKTSQINALEIFCQFEDGFMNFIIVNEFRVATEAEIIKNKIKKIFIKST